MVSLVLYNKNGRLYLNGPQDTMDQYIPGKVVHIGSQQWSIPTFIERTSCFSFLSDSDSLGPFQLGTKPIPGTVLRENPYGV